MEDLLTEKSSQTNRLQENINLVRAIIVQNLKSRLVDLNSKLQQHDVTHDFLHK